MVRRARQVALLPLHHVARDAPPVDPLLAALAERHVHVAAAPRLPAHRALAETLLLRVALATVVLVVTPRRRAPPLPALLAREAVTAHEQVQVLIVPVLQTRLVERPVASVARTHLPVAQLRRQRRAAHLADLAVRASPTLAHLARHRPAQVHAVHVVALATVRAEQHAVAVARGPAAQTHVVADRAAVPRQHALRHHRHLHHRVRTRQRRARLQLPTVHPVVLDAPHHLRRLQIRLLRVAARRRTRRLLRLRRAHHTHLLHVLARMCLTPLALQVRLALLEQRLRALPHLVAHRVVHERVRAHQLEVLAHLLHAIVRLAPDPRLHHLEAHALLARNQVVIVRRELLADRVHEDARRVPRLQRAHHAPHVLATTRRTPVTPILLLLLLTLHALLERAVLATTTLLLCAVALAVHPLPTRTTLHTPTRLRHTHRLQTHVAEQTLAIALLALLATQHTLATHNRVFPTTIERHFRLAPSTLRALEAHELTRLLPTQLTATRRIAARQVAEQPTLHTSVQRLLRRPAQTAPAVLLRHGLQTHQLLVAHAVHQHVLRVQVHPPAVHRLVLEQHEVLPRHRSVLQHHAATPPAQRELHLALPHVHPLVHPLLPAHLHALHRHLERPRHAPTHLLAQTELPPHRVQQRAERQLQAVLAPVAHGLHLRLAHRLQLAMLQVQHATTRARLHLLLHATAQTPTAAHPHQLAQHTHLALLQRVPPTLALRHALEHHVEQQQVRHAVQHEPQQVALLQPHAAAY